MDDAIAVALKVVAIGMLRLGKPASERVLHCIGSEHEMSVAGRASGRQHQAVRELRSVVQRFRRTAGLRRPPSNIRHKDAELALCLSAHQLLNFSLLRSASVLP